MPDGLTDAELVEELCDVESGLSTWEENFVESIAKWFEDHGELTYGQRKKALEIHAQKCG